MHFNENKYRIKFLHDFILLYEKYLQDSSSLLRNQICKQLAVTSHYIREAGIPTHNQTPTHGNVDIFANIFDDFFAPPRDILDRLYSAIGNYELLQRQWEKKISNPLYWIASLVRLPFIVLSFSGINITKIETNLLSKAYKIFITFFLYFSSLVGILSYFGITVDVVLSFFGIHKK